jgi:cysteine-rich repeat protein
MSRIQSIAMLVLAAITGATTVVGETTWSVATGHSRVIFDANRLSELGLIVESTNPEHREPLHGLTLDIGADSDLTLRGARGVLTEFAGGAIVHDGGVMLRTDAQAVALDRLSIAPHADGAVDRFVAGGQTGLLLGDVKLGYDEIGQILLIEGAEVAISAPLADALGRPELAGEIIGGIRTMAAFRWVAGDRPQPVDRDAPVTRGGTICDRPGGADVIVGDLIDVSNYASSGGIEAFAIGTTSCNVGDVDLNWIANTNDHPVIAQNMYRLKDGRFEQVGQSWLKHGFTALTQNICGCGCNGNGGSVLGVGCSDPYCCGLNGQQDGLGPRFEVNPSTGVFPYPATDLSLTGNSVYKRLQVAIADLDPAQDGGGQYFAEGHYIAKDDAAAGNQANNASYRPITVSGGGSAWSISLAGVTAREQPAIRAWQDFDPTVEEVDVMIPNDGLVIVAAKATSLGGGIWNYEYAIQNIYSDRAVGGFIIPVGGGAQVTNIGFHDVAYHSGEPFDGTDWTGTYDGNFVTWATTPHGTDPNANAIRWGTLYNFRFDANRAPSTVTARIEAFKPGSPTTAQFSIVGPLSGPQDCNSNGIDDADDIANGESRDCDGNGIPDECESFPTTPLRTALVASGLSSPVALATPPGESNRLFVCEQNSGLVRIIKNGVLLPQPFLDIGALASSGGERGLLSIAFHPDFSTNGFFFVNYTDNAGDTVIARYGLTVDPDTADPTTATIIKTIAQDAANHNGGQLQFGPDGYLYVGMGDGGGGDDPLNRAQDPQSLLGKILRLDVDNGPPYIPPSNPFVGDGSTLDEIWALGMRNPWRFSFDRDTGDLYIGDVGQITREEIDFQPAGSPGGENYGWDCEEGFIATPTNNGGYGCTAGDPSLVPPILDVSHSDSGTCSITGGYVYRGCQMPDLNGTYFFADVCGGYVRSFRYSDGDPVPPPVSDRTAELSPISGSIVSFGEDADGELYIVTLGGNVYKIVADTGPACGDHLVEGSEECDDGNTQDGDGCDSACQVEGAFCGDGEIEAGEQCDPPDGVTCSDTCQALPCTTAFADQFESDRGWTVDNVNLTAGAWERGTPAGLGDRNDPTSDFDGSGQCYLTQNGAGNTDVDGGPTRLVSPVLDLSGGNATLSYAYWMDSPGLDGTDGLYVEVSVNGGASWTQIAGYTTPANQWQTDSILLDSFVTPSANTQVRFAAQDNPNNSILECGIDDVTVSVTCVDCNSNGIDDLDEIAAGTSADCDNNGQPDDCDLAAGALDCDGGPVGVISGGATIVQSICFGCHNSDGSGGAGFPGPNIRNRSRVTLWNKLQNPEAGHPGGLFLEFTQQDFADIEAYLADGGSRGRPDLIPDVCQTLADCDEDGPTDACELEDGTQIDADYDGVPDDCSACPTTTGDGDANCTVDLYDYALLQGCYSTDGVAYAAGCACFDADADGDVDGADLGLMQSLWTGPAVTAGGCVTP